MAARVQMEQIKPEEFNLKGMKFKADQSTTYVLIKSFIKQLTLVVKQCSFHACNKSDHLQCALKPPLYSIFVLPWQCDIMEYSSILRDLFFCMMVNLYKIFSFLPGDSKMYSRLWS